MPAPRLVKSDSWLDDVGESFARALIRQDLSPKTVRSYGIGIRNLFAFLRENGVDDFAKVTRDLLERWQDSLRDREPPLKAGSRSLYCTSVKQLIRWAAERDIVDLKLERAIVGVQRRHRTPEEERQPIESEDLARLMTYLGPRKARATLVELRDRALFFVLLETGARVNEALQMPRENFDRCRVRQKGGSYVTLELTPSVSEFVLEYVRRRTDDLPNLWIAIGNHGGAERPLADSGVREAWRRLCQRVDVPRFTTHQLRHSAATILLEHGVEGLAVADHLHHADLRTVQRYAKVRGSLRQHTLDVMERFVHDGARTRADLLERRSPPGGRPRYR